MYTYGYIREATLAHLDIDESEAQAMNILARFHIFANEAMQAICAAKPKYDYIDVTIVDEYKPVIYDTVTSSFRDATQEEIDDNDVNLLDEKELVSYYNKQNIYNKLSKVSVSDDFISFVDKQAWKNRMIEPTIPEMIEADMTGKILTPRLEKLKAKIDDDFSYVNKNQIKFYKTGNYQIPAKYFWYVFESGMSDESEIEMPIDILMTIPLYIASVCLQIENPTKAQLKRSDFEIALARCSSSDYMTPLSISPFFE